MINTITWLNQLRGSHINSRIYLQGKNNCVSSILKHLLYLVSLLIASASYCFILPFSLRLFYPSPLPAELSTFAYRWNDSLQYSFNMFAMLLRFCLFSFFFLSEFHCFNTPPLPTSLYLHILYLQSWVSVQTVLAICSTGTLNTCKFRNSLRKIHHKLTVTGSDCVI